ATGGRGGSAPPGGSPVQDEYEEGRKTVAAVAFRPAQAEEPGVVEGGMPVRLARPILVVGRGRREAGVVVGEPRTEATAERRLLRGVTEVHRPPPAVHVRAHGAVCRRRRTTARRASRAAG